MCRDPDMSSNAPPPVDVDKLRIVNVTCDHDVGGFVRKRVAEAEIRLALHRPGVPPGRRRNVAIMGAANGVAHHAQNA